MTRILRSGRVRNAAALFAVAVAAIGCRAADADPVPSSTAPSVLQSIPDSAWSALAGRRIFFGHQSVGANILQGVQEIMANDPRVRVRLVQSTNPESVDGPALVHAPVGENRHPDSKDAAFARIMDAGFGKTGDVAIYKYCYVDMTPSTDVKVLFEGYKRTMDALEARYPRLTFVHVTQPLFAEEGVLSSKLRLALGKASERVLNAKRNEFNRMLLAEYGKTGAVFDLAGAESTRPDGSRVFYRAGSDTVYALAPEYTSDGGHLDARGRRAVAERFLAFLATLRPAS